MSKTSKINIIGQKFGILTVLSEVVERNKNGHILYIVKCDCGKEKQVLGASLRSGMSRSCNKCPLLTGTHGMWKSREFSIWSSLKDRCYNPNNPNYKNYGGRGITVCEKWLKSFENFYSDMGKSNDLSVDRIDVNGNYCPENCRWATPTEQARNRTNNVLFLYRGEEKCASEWCEIYNMATSTFHNRLKRGWNIEKILEEPINIKHRKDEL